MFLTTPLKSSMTITSPTLKLPSNIMKIPVTTSSTRLWAPKLMTRAMIPTPAKAAEVLNPKMVNIQMKPIIVTSHFTRLLRIEVTVFTLLSFERLLTRSMPQLSRVLTSMQKSMAVKAAMSLGRLMAKVPPFERWLMASRNSLGTSLPRNLSMFVFPASTISTSISVMTVTFMSMPVFFKLCLRSVLWSYHCFHIIP